MADNLELVIRAKNLTKEQFDEITRQVQALGGEVEKTSGAMGGGATQAAAFGLAAGVGAIAVDKLAEASVAAYHALIDVVAGFVSAGSAIDDLRLKTGLGVQALQEYSFAGSLVGVSAETIGTSVVRMSKNIEEGTAKTRNAIRDLNLNFAALQAMSPEEQFQAIATAIQQLPSAGAQASAAFALFGRNAEILKVVRSDFAGAAEDAKRFGFIMSGEAVAGADALGDAVTTLTATWDGLKNKLAESIVKNSEATEAARGLSVVLVELEAEAGKVGLTWGTFLAQLGQFVVLAAPVVQSLKLIKDALAEIGKQELPALAAASRTAWGQMAADQIDFDAILARGVKQSVEDVKEGEKAKTTARREATAAAKAASKEIADAFKKDVEAQVFAANYFEKEAKKAWDDLVTAVKAANELIEKDTADAYTKMQQKVKEFAEQGIRNMRDEQEQANIKLGEQLQLFGNLGDSLGVVTQLFDVFGVSSDSALRGIVDLGFGALDVMSRLASGDIWGAINAGISAILRNLGLIGDFFNWLGGFFGGVAGSPYHNIPPWDPNNTKPQDPTGGGWEPPPGFPGGNPHHHPGGGGDEGFYGGGWALPGLMAQAMAGAGAANGGSYMGGGQTIVNKIYINERELGKSVTRLTRRRQGRVTPGAVRRT